MKQRLDATASARLIQDIITPTPQQAGSSRRFWRRRFAWRPHRPQQPGRQDAIFSAADQSVALASINDRLRKRKS